MSRPPPARPLPALFAALALVCAPVAAGAEAPEPPPRTPPRSAPRVYHAAPPLLPWGTIAGGLAAAPDALPPVLLDLRRGRRGEARPRELRPDAPAPGPER